MKEILYIDELFLLFKTDGVIKRYAKIQPWIVLCICGLKLDTFFTCRRQQTLPTGKTLIGVARCPKLLSPFETC